MIKVTRFDQSELIVNADLIEFIEQTPDTVISMLTGRKVLALEPAEEIVRRIIAFREQASRRIIAPAANETLTMGETRR
jgi:flagellar protein FlbD